MKKEPAKLLIVFAVFCFTSCINKKEQSAKEPTALKGTDSIYNKYRVIEEIGKRIKFENIPATNVVYVKYTGSYRQHPEAFPKLQNYAYTNYAAIGNCLGFYPFDPDAVAEKDLNWEIAIRIIPGAPSGMMMHEMETGNDPFHLDVDAEQLGAPLSKLKKPSANFALKTLPSITAIAVTTTVEKAGIDGLAMNAWLTINGYAQTGTARMEFAMQEKDPMKVPVKINIPVAKRKTGLTLTNN